MSEPTSRSPEASTPGEPAPRNGDVSPAVGYTAAKASTRITDKFREIVFYNTDANEQIEAMNLREFIDYMLPLAGASDETGNAEWDAKIKGYENGTTRFDEMPQEMQTNARVLDIIDTIISIKLLHRIIEGHDTRLINKKIISPEKRIESGERALSNADIARFLNNEPIVLNKELFELANKDRSGKTKYTNVLHLQLFRKGEYGPSMRYVFRDLIWKLVTDGSKREKREALFFIKNLVQELGAGYQDADLSTLEADAAFAATHAKEVDAITGSGERKSDTFKGQGFTRQTVASYADSIPDTVKFYAIFGGKLKDPKNLDENDRAVFERYKNNYDSMPNSIRSNFDTMREYAYTLGGGTGHDAIRQLDGDNQRIIADMFWAYAEIDRTRNEAALLMIGLDPSLPDPMKNLRERAATLFERFPPSANAVSPSPMEDSTRIAIANFAHLPYEPQASKRQFVQADYTLAV